MLFDFIGFEEYNILKDITMKYLYNLFYNMYVIRSSAGAELWRHM